MPTSEKKLYSAAVTLHNAAATLGAPSGATAGGDVSTWAQGGFVPEKIALIIEADATATLSDAWLCVYDAGRDKSPAAASWLKAVELNGTADIVLSATLGYEEIVESHGDAARWAIFATVSAGNITVRAIPLEER